MLYHALVAVIIRANFPEPGKFLSGWDALHPEFNFALNWQRSLYGVWQSNYGVGALVGHGFAALLPHIAVSWLLSLLLPLAAIRPAFIFLCYYLGGLGMLLLTRQLLGRLFRNNQNLNLWISLVASAYYLFNLGTVQQFYLPLEAFTVQFALVPWFFWSLNRYWQKPIKGTLLLFALINFLGSVQGFIPVLFITLLLVFGTWLIVANLDARNIEAIKKSVAVLIVFMLVNAYWLLPFGYYVIDNDGHFLQAYNNQLSTPEFVAKSEAYGTLADVVLLKSFYLDGIQPDGRVFDPWLDHINNGWYQLVGWSLFAIMCVGWIYAWVQKQEKAFRAYVIAGWVVFGFLATQVPPFSWYMGFLYQHSNLFEQVFRTSFTKFGLLLAGFYSLFFGIGLVFIVTRFKHLLKTIIGFIALGSILLGLVFCGWPVFNGHLFDSQLVVAIPQAYFEVMDDFKRTEEGRIAELPIECSEGWFSRDWGYYGSGFMWFGIPQSYLARTFDVWSSGNENFYFEARYALRQPDFEGLDKVLKKYGVRYVYVDENLKHCRSGNGLDHFKDLEKYLSSDPRFALRGEYPDPALDKPLRVYEFKSDTAKLVFTPNRYVLTVKANSRDEDKLYANYGAYMETDKVSTVSYVFDNDSFTIDKDSVVANTTSKNNGRLRISSYQDSERYLPMKISLQPTEHAGSFMGIIEFLGPTIKVNNQTVSTPPSVGFGPVVIQSLESLALATDNIAMKKVNDTEFIGTYFVGSVNNIVASCDGNKRVWWSSQNSTVIQEYLTHTLEIPVTADVPIEVIMPKIFDQGAFGNVILASDFSLPENCSGEDNNGQTRYELGTKDKPVMELISQADDYCIRVKFNGAYSAGGYIIKLTTKHIEGLPFYYNLTNWRGISYLGNYLHKSQSQIETTLIAPPVFERDLNYTLELKNESFGNKPTINDVYGVEYWFIPYRFITSAHVVSDTSRDGGFQNLIGDSQIDEPFTSSILRINEVEQINPLKYEVSVVGNGLLVLNQGFDKAWIGMSSGRLLRHVKVNGWANGWVLDRPISGEVVIFYWPQFLEWVGFGILLVSGFVLVGHGFGEGRWSGSSS